MRFSTSIISYFLTSVIRRIFLILTSSSWEILDWRTLIRRFYSGDMSSMVAQAMGIYRKLNDPVGHIAQSQAVSDGKDPGEYFSDEEDIPAKK